MSEIISLVRRARALVLAGLVLCGIAAPRLASAQLEVSQLEVFLRPGAALSSRAGTFTVTNVSTETVTTQLTIGDWERAMDGTNQYSDSTGIMRGSCFNTLRVFPAVLNLAPQQSQAVTVNYDGDSRTNACWSLVMIRMAPKPATITNGAQITVQLLQGIKIYVEPPTGRPDLLIDSVDTGPHKPPTTESQADTTGMDIVALVHNPGAIQARVHGRVEYRSLKDSLVATRNIDEFPILPGAQRKVRSRMPVLAAGHYVALVILDFGGSELVAAQVELNIR